MWELRPLEMTPFTGGSIASQCQLMRVRNHDAERLLPCFILLAARLTGGEFGVRFSVRNTGTMLVMIRLSGNRVSNNRIMKEPAVYIMASQRNGTLYIGVTSDLRQRVWQHKTDIVDGFTKKYAVHTLVWFEIHESMDDAILRERQLKKWNRKWKLRLIEETNPEWKDLFDSTI